MRTPRRASLAADSPIWRLPDLTAVLGGAAYFHTDDALAETPPELHYLLDGAPAQQLAVPLRVGTTVSGMICVDNLLSGTPITPADSGPLMALANGVGLAIEKARLQERERAERVVEAVAHHHERWDGQGYPAGRRGVETPLVGRIMQIADAVSAMTMDRPYRAGLSWEAVVAELQAQAGTQFDPDLVAVFIAATRQTRVAS
jgi:hypothetical protein